MDWKVNFEPWISHNWRIETIFLRFDTEKTFTFTPTCPWTYWILAFFLKKIVPFGSFSIELMPFYFTCIVVYFICRPKARSASSIILRGANDFMLDEMERSMHDAICVVKRVLESKTVVPGGGAVEAALSIYLENFATSLVSEMLLFNFLSFLWL